MSYMAKDTRIRAERRVSEVSDKPCDCGCGQFTMVSTKTDHKRGWVKGEPRRFVKGHGSRTGKRKPSSRVVEPWRPRFAIDSETGCWNWLLFVSVRGYGRAWRSGKQVPAHRAMWEDEFGPIPEGHVVHHRCENKRCVNPDHLELLEHGEHSRLHGAVWAVQWKGGTHVKAA